MNWDFVAHIIRDVFPQPVKPIIYGDDTSCLEVFHSSLHGLGFHMLYSGDPTDKRVTFSHHWNITDAIQHLGIGYCDLFVYFEKDTMFPMGTMGSTSGNLYALMGEKGLLFLVNPGEWSDSLGSAFRLRDDYIEEIKSYSMFREERVLVYEKI